MTKLTIRISICEESVKRRYQPGAPEEKDLLVSHGRNLTRADIFQC